MTRPLDPEETMNHLLPEAIGLWEEHDPYLAAGLPVSNAYAEGKIELSLRTLLDIAHLPTTDPEDTR